MPTPLSNLLVCVIAATALITTLWRGPRTAFILIALPCIVLLSEVPSMDIILLPDPGAAFGAMYGILLGLLLRGGEKFTFRWSGIDILVLLIAAAQVVSSAVNGILWTGVSSWGSQFLGWVAPYFLARLAYQSWHDRKLTLKCVAFCILFIAFFAMIECRLWPHFYRNMIHKILGMQPLVQLAYRRYGFFRADSAFSHPIYLGNACIALMGLVMVLTRPAGYRMKDWRIWCLFIAGIFAVLTGISYGSYMGLASAVFFFLAMRYMSIVRKLLMPLALCTVILGVVVTMQLRHVSTESGDNAPGWERSFRTRVLIIKRGWPMAASGGLWGHGRNISQQELGLESVDNAYLLWAMRQGWVYLCLWLLIPILLAHRGAKVFATIRRPELRTPLAGGLACLFAVMVAMYTVWSSWTFVSIWTVLLGFVVSLMDFHLQASRAAPAIRRSRQPTVSSRASQGNEPLILVPEA